MENNQDNSQNNERKDIVLYCTRSNEISDVIEQHCKASSITSIRLNDKLLDDYLKAESNEKQEPKPTLQEFISNEKNKEEVETKALTLWNLLTHNGDIKNSINRIFTKSEITNKTNLTHKTLGDLLELFSLFGFIEYVKGNYEFKFIFGEQTRRNSVYLDVAATADMLNQNIVRYLSMFAEGEERDKAREEMKNNLQELVKF